MKLAFAPLYCHPLPPGHRFPMEKYALLPEQLLREGIIEESMLFAPQALTRHEVERIHSTTYVEKLLNGTLSKQEIRKTGFPWSAQLVEREMLICGGTVMNTQYAIAEGVSMNIAGGTHHAFRDRGEGFCLFNDIALGADALLQAHPNWQILVVDLDVHQGNGTAAIFQTESRVFTFSMHGKSNYPLHKEHSDLDVPLEDGCNDQTYLYLLEKHLDLLFQRLQPNFVFYQSGVDVLATDKLGRLSLSREGCKKRDALVFQHCKKAEVPVAVSMGGGYSEKLTDILEAHVNTFREAARIWS